MDSFLLLKDRFYPLVQGFGTDGGRSIASNQCTGQCDETAAESKARSKPNHLLPRKIKRIGIQNEEAPIPNGDDYDGDCAAVFADGTNFFSGEGWCREFKKKNESAEKQSKGNGGEANEAKDPIRDVT